MAEDDSIPALVARTAPVRRGGRFRGDGMAVTMARMRPAACPR